MGIHVVWKRFQPLNPRVATHSIKSCIILRGWGCFSLVWFFLLNVFFWPRDPAGKRRHLRDRDPIYQLLPCIIHIDTFDLCSFFVVRVCSSQASLIFHIRMFIFNVYPKQTPTQTQSHKVAFLFVSPAQIRAISADGAESAKNEGKKKLFAPPGKLNKRGFIRNKGK